MILPRICVLDACFIIDWIRWRNSDVVKRVFASSFIPESTLRELTTPAPLRAIREWISAGWLTIYPHFRELEDEALDFILNARADPRVPRIDMPEAICTVLAKRLKAAVLTENRGILRAYQLKSEVFGPAVVMNSLRLLAHLYREGFFTESFDDLVKEYERDTKHAFSSREIDLVKEDFGI